MSVLRWFCGECLYGQRSTSDDVSSVRVRPTPDGGFVIAAGKPDKPLAEQALPCLTLNVAEMVIVSEHCPDNWDPINLSSEIHRV
jgi:predicted sugar kinase